MKYVLMRAHRAIVCPKVIGDSNYLFPFLTFLT